MAGITSVGFLLLAAACSDSSGPSGGVAVLGNTATLASIDETVQLTAVALDRHADPIPGVQYTWSTSNAAVATVNGSGLVTARGNGTATITAHADNHMRGDTVVEVEQAPVAIAVSPTEWPDAWVGARQQFAASIIDANGYPVADAIADWSSSSASDVRVDTNGLATAYAEGGTAYVTAQVGGLTSSAQVGVPYTGSNGPGAMYTLWVARTDIAPAVLANGRLRVPDDVLGSVSYETPVTPWHREAPGAAHLIDPDAPNSGAFEVDGHNTINKFQWQGNRIGLLTDMADGLGTFRVVDRASEWVVLAIGNTSDFQLEGNRIGLLQENGEFRVKDGIHGAWSVLVAAGADAFRLEGDRIGVLHDDGEFRVKDGIAGAWTVLAASGTADFQLADDRIGVLSDDGSFRVKDGIHGAWTLLANDAANFRLRGNRIALLHLDGRFRVKDGIHGEWTTLATEPIRQYELEGNRIGILFEDGEFRVKDGIDGPWTVLATSGVRQFQLQGNRIGELLGNGALRIRSGVSGSPATTAAYGESAVTQFRLKVDVPVPPFRTTPAYYNQKQAQCIAYTDDVNDCHHVSSFAVPVAFYGWYCGDDRPYGFQAIIRDKRYLSDSLDAVCRHHDTVGSWYPGAGGFGSGNLFASCVVRYGLRHGRLTRNGALLADGYTDNPEWDDAWATVGMVNLKDALDNYFTYTLGCSESDLASFDLEYRTND